VHGGHGDGLPAGQHPVSADCHPVHDGDGDGLPARPDAVSGDERNAVRPCGRNDVPAPDAASGPGDDRKVAARAKAVMSSTRAVARAAALFLVVR
jgi:hypothetical protein